MNLTKYQNEWVRIYEKKKCKKCKKDRDTKLQTCEVCTQKERVRKLNYVNNKREKGICLFCTTPVKDGFLTCNRNSCIPSRRLRT